MVAEENLAEEETKTRVRKPRVVKAKERPEAPFVSNPKLAVYGHNYIAYGSPEHAAMLGLVGDQLRDPLAIEARKEALEAVPKTMNQVAESMGLPEPRKKAITPKTYTPEDHIIDGFYRVGR